MEASTPSSQIEFDIRRVNNDDFTKLSSFTCGVDSLDTFFQLEVEECVRNHYLAAYVAVNPNEEIIAAFTLMNDALMITSEDERNDLIEDISYCNDEFADFLNLQTSYPAINIGHLGTAIDYQRHAIGRSIIDLVVETFTQYKQAGCQFITVDALNNKATTKFYLSNGFTFQTDKDFFATTRRMYRILPF